MSEIGKLLEATKPFRDEIAQLRTEVEILKNHRDRLLKSKVESDDAWVKLRKRLDDAELQVGVLKVFTKKVADLLVLSKLNLTEEASALAGEAAIIITNVTCICSQKKFDRQTHGKCPVHYPNDTCNHRWDIMESPGRRCYICKSVQTTWDKSESCTCDVSCGCHPYVSGTECPHCGGRCA